MTRASSLMPGASVEPSARRSVAVIAVIAEVPVEPPALQQDEHQEQDPDHWADGLLQMLHGFEGTAPEPCSSTARGHRSRRRAMRANVGRVENGRPAR
jgi:hypothetical protein